VDCVTATAARRESADAEHSIGCRFFEPDHGRGPPALASTPLRRLPQPLPRTSRQFGSAVARDVGERFALDSYCYGIFGSDRHLVVDDSLVHVVLVMRQAKAPIGSRGVSVAIRESLGGTLG
jgi:hypothetical protein